MNPTETQVNPRRASLFKKIFLWILKMTSVFFFLAHMFKLMTAGFEEEYKELKQIFSANIWDAYFGDPRNVVILLEGI